MRLRRPRFTVRRLMIVVAVAALAIGGIIEGERRRARFRELAGCHFRLTILNPHDAHDRVVVWVIDETPQGRYHSAMSKKYLRAGRYPWLPVWPDPPEPE